MAGDDAVLPCDKAILTVRMNQREEFERMNKNGHSATMYETIPAVAGLNRVEGFEPFSLLGPAVSPATGEAGLQLGLAYKKLWFRLANPRGRLQMNRISLTEQLAVFEAQVYLDCDDENPVSSFVSGCTREEAPGGRYIQEAQHEAMDVALTDAGFGLQFADVSADVAQSGAADAGTGEKPVQGAGTETVPSGNGGHTGTVVRAFPGVSAGNGVKAAQTQVAQPAGTRQPVQADAMPQGKETMPAGTRQSVPATVTPQSQMAQPAERKQPVQAAIPQGQMIQPAGGRQTVPPTMPQKQMAQPAGTRQLVQSAMPQGQVTQPAGTRQPVSAAMPQGRMTQPAGTRQPVQAATPQGQMIQPAETRKTVQATMPQGQGTQPAGTRQAVAATMPQGQGMQPGGNPTQPVAAPISVTGKAVPGGTQPGGTATDAASGMQAAAQKLSMAVQGKVNPSAGSMDGNALPVEGQQLSKTAQAGPHAVAQSTTTSSPARPVRPDGAEQNQVANHAGVLETERIQACQEQNVQSGKTKGKTQPATVPNRQPHEPAAVLPARTPAPQGQTDRLLVPPASSGREGTVRTAADVTAGSLDSLPVPPMGNNGQATVEAATSATDTFPVPAGSPDKGNAQSSVQEAMALLKGQMLPADVAGNTAGSDTAGDMTANAAEAPMEISEGCLPVDGEKAQGGHVPRYTPDMPVEEIVSLMTLEEAGKVVVDTGVSKGQTVAEVAERRPPSLKYYRYGGYKGNNNILRAAAQVMLDSMEGQKAG